HRRSYAEADLRRPEEHAGRSAVLPMVDDRSRQDDRPPPPAGSSARLRAFRRAPRWYRGRTASISLASNIARLPASMTAAGGATVVSEHRADLVRELLTRDVRLRYRRSVLGLFWSQLNPLAQIVIFSVIFTRVVPLHIRNYPLFVFVGVMAWQWFESAL